MTSHDDDKVIDFKKLETELHNAVEADAKYWRENDAKFRAVGQKVATYEEFTDIVKASHLKPLEKDDRLTNIKFIQPWNVSAQKQKLNADKEKTDVIPKGGSYPTSGQAFIREWRRFSKDTVQQYSYLLELGGQRLMSIFKTEIGFGLLGEFAKCLNCELKDEDINVVMDIMDHLRQTNRFSLTVQFLSSKEKEDINGLFFKLRKCFESVDRCDEVNEKLTELEKVYEVKK